MRVNWLMHKTDRYVTPMIIVSDDGSAVAARILETSTHCSHIKPNFADKKLEQLDLDPGGMYFMKTPHVQFDIDGITCDIQVTKAEDVIAHMNTATERLPGMMRFRMWFWNFVMPKTFFESLKAKLTEISKSDDALHGHITEDEIREKIEAECPYVRFDIPREP